MPRVKRLRWTDWLGLVGLVMLLAWTPGYVAQDPTERALTGGETFTLPMPRDGDRAVLDLVVQDANGDVKTYEGLIEILIESVSPEPGGPVPTEATFRHSLSHREADIDLGFARYTSNQTTRDAFYDSEGAVVWRSSTGINFNQAEPSVGDYDDSMVAERTESCERLGLLNAYPGTPVRYEPGAWGRELGSISDSLYDREGIECFHFQRRGQAFVADQASRFGPHLLLGQSQHKLHLDRLFDDRDAYRTCPLRQDGTAYANWFNPVHRSGVSSQSLDIPLLLRVTEDHQVRCDYRDPPERWEWLSPEFPLPVGLHARYEDPAGKLLFQLDFVPRVLERGNGPSLAPLVQPPTGWLKANPVDEAPPAVASIPLHSLGADDTPLLHGHSLHFVDETIRTNAPDSLQEFLDRGAYMAGVQAGTSGAHTEDRDSHWMIRYALPTGETHTATLALSWMLVPVPSDIPRPVSLSPLHGPLTNDTRTWTATVDDACEQAGSDEVRARLCSSVVPSAVAPNRPLMAPSALREHVAGLTSSAHGNAWEPIGSARAGFSLGFPGGASSWGLATQIPDGNGVMFQTSGTHNATTGVLDAYRNEHYVHSPDSQPVRTPDTYAPSGSSAQPVVLEPVPAAVAWSGLLLLLVGAVMRLVSVGKSGTIAGFAVGLYAKIRNEDVLEHERREAIVEALRAEPGMTAKELAACLGAGWGATIHHLETLRRSGLVTRVAMGRNRHHFLARETTPDQRRLLALRREPAYAAFLDAVGRDPGRNLEELAGALKQGRSGLSRTGTRLAREGLIDKRRDRFSVRFYPSAAPGPETRK